MLVHGDDFLCVGSAKHLAGIAERMGRKFEVQVTVTGKENRKELCALNRSIRWTPQGIMCESERPWMARRKEYEGNPVWDSGQPLLLAKTTATTEQAVSR